MHSRFRMKGVLLAVLVAVIASVALPHGASAEPQPGVRKKGFRLFARALGALTVNRIYCGLASDGQVCVDSTNSSTIGGGFWPKGTPDQYIFNSGLQVAGVVGADGGPWKNDTVGGFFFDPKGTTQHGEEVQPIFNASNPADLAAWPEAACVPFGDVSADLFDELLTTDPTNTDPAYSFPCRKSASQGDVWWMSWDGNPSLRAGRKHPIGVLVETRGMGWNFPAGNEDILYFIYTFYNVTSTNAADYAAYRPSIRSILLQKAADFQSSVAATGVTLPVNGYTMTNLFAAFARDDDVAEAGSNYSSVNLPFALGYTYDHSFGQPEDWKFDPSLFSAPFFAGSGFTGTKYLKSPTGAGAIQLFSNTINGQPFPGAVNDPRDLVQLYRYLSGTLSPATGDQPCNTGNPAVSRICFVNNTSPQDMRFFQSSTPLTLGPGQSGSIVVAYIFAAAVQTAGCGATCDVKPGDATRLTNAAQLAVGANTVDSLTGFRKWTDNPLAPDGIVEQDEFTVVKNSLLGKSLVAQAVFDGKFLLPFAPTAPEFFLVPGDNQVTILWRPSTSEVSGDPFFALASAAKVGVGQNNNPLYDPNYRQFDVEGYRVYRGRVDAPNELVLLAQFDYAGTTIADFTGIINPTGGCAPEYAINTDCAVAYAPNLKNGTTLTVSLEHDLVGPIVQVNSGTGRTALADGTALILKADSALTGDGTNGRCGPRSACPELSNSGIPFVFVDNTPRNNFRYFYSVTAFDVNSVESGPTSLESPRNTKSVRPVRPAGNFISQGSTSFHVVGRGVAMDTVIRTVPTLNPTNGTFSGPFPPADGASLGFVGQFVSRLFAAPGTITAELTGLTLGDARNGVAVTYTYKITGSNGAVTNVTVPIAQSLGGDVTASTAPAPVATADSTLSADYGIPPLQVAGLISTTIPSYQEAVAWGRGCIDGAITPPAGSTCLYNNPRWFAADTSEPANPTANNAGATGSTNLSNAGRLPNVATIYTPHSLQNVDQGWRAIEATLGGAIRAADFKVYWGTAGKVDSILDVTHNVRVPLDATSLGGGFGILTQAASNAAGSFDTRPGVLTLADFGCVPPFRGGSLPGWSAMACSSAAPFPVTDSVILGPVAMHTGVLGGLTSVAARPNPGFAMYLSGHLFVFEMNAGQPAPANTVWVLRSYTGAIFGGSGAGGNFGNYTFQEATRPFTAIGAQLSLSYSAQNAVRAPTGRDLRNVHTVPDPYYVTSEYEQTTDTKIIKFVNLPDKAIIRIYSSSGVLVNLLENPGPNCFNVGRTGVADNPTGGECTWNVRNRNNQVVASGVYFYHIEANTGGGTARRVGRMTIVNFAQ